MLPFLIMSLSAKPKNYLVLLYIQNLVIELIRGQLIRLSNPMGKFWPTMSTK